MREYAVRRGWQITAEIKEIGSGRCLRPKREELLAAVRRREVDAILVWRLDRWGRSLPDLVITLKELAELGIGFVSLTEAFDMTTPTGRALAGMLAVFAEFEHEILRERVKAGIAQARAKGTIFGRPKSAAKKTRRNQAPLSQGKALKIGNCKTSGHRQDLGTPPAGEFLTTQKSTLRIVCARTILNFPAPQNVSD